MEDAGGGRVYGCALLLESCLDDFEGLEEDARDKAAQAARNQILRWHRGGLAAVSKAAALVLLSRELSEKSWW